MWAVSASARWCGDCSLCFRVWGKRKVCVGLDWVGWQKILKKRRGVMLSSVDKSCHVGPFAR